MRHRTNLYVAMYFFLVHGLAVFLGLYFFSWTGFMLCLGLTVFFELSITIGYHRGLTHDGFETWPFLRKVMAVWGMLAGEGPPLIWVANHRKHHQYSDQEGDPHSPLDGFAHAHIWWMTYFKSKSELSALFKRYAPKMLKEPFMLRLNQLYIPVHFAFATSFFVVGWLLGGWRFGLSLLAWGYFFRICLLWHITWSVNSWTHLKFLGYRNYETTDQSRNNPVVAVLAQGEGWHNNHHAHPTCTWHGHKWWERLLDLSGILIWIMKKLHIIWNVKDKIPDST